MRSSLCVALLAAAMAVRALAGDLANAGSRFIPLGALPHPSAHSRAFDVSGDGRIAIGRSSWPDHTEAVRWTIDHSIQAMGDLPGAEFMSTANAVSWDGSVVTGVGTSTSGREAFLWTGTTGMVGLGDLPGSGFSSAAFGISWDGNVVVGDGQSSMGVEAFRWELATGMVGLGDLSGGQFFSRAHAISGDGSTIVGVSTSSDGFEAFRWTSELRMSGLGDLPGRDFFSMAVGVSRDGSVVVGRSQSQIVSEAYRWTENGGMEGLGYVPVGGTPASAAVGVSADGSVVVGATGQGQRQQAFIWTPASGMRLLCDVLREGGAIGLEGWRLDEAWRVSAGGTVIVGFGENPEGLVEAWAAIIPRSANVDFKPGSCPNPLNRNSRGKVPVAVLGTNEFDVSMIEVESLVLTRSDGIGGIVSPLNGPPGPRVRIEDVATPFEGEPCDCHALQGDGVDDLSMKFDTQTLVAELELNDLPGGAAVELVISGQLLDGTHFSGGDCIRLVPPNGGEQGFALNDGQSTVGDIQPKPLLSVGVPKENAEAKDESPTQTADPAPIGCGGIMPSLLFATSGGIWLIARRLPKRTAP